MSTTTNKSVMDMSMNEILTAIGNTASSVGSSLSAAGTAVVDYEFSLRGTCNALGHALITDVPAPKAPVLQLLPSAEELSTMSNEEQIRLLTARIRS
jgi:hypothetical protein